MSFASAASAQEDFALQIWPGHHVHLSWTSNLEQTFIGTSRTYSDTYYTHLNAFKCDTPLDDFEY